MALPTVWPEKVKPMVRAVSSRGNHVVMVRFGSSSSALGEAEQGADDEHLGEAVTAPVSMHRNDHEAAAQL